MLVAICRNFIMFFGVCENQSHIGYREVERVADAADKSARRAACCTPTVLYTKIVGQCDQLATVVGQLLSVPATTDGKMFLSLQFGKMFQSSLIFELPE